MGYIKNTKEQPAESQQNICGSRTRSGGLCENSPEAGRKRCRLHGGAPGSGAPIGNKNALKHGLFSASGISERRTLKAYLKEMQEMVKGYSGL